MQYEIEIKSLLGSKAASDELLRKVTERDPATRLVSTQHQLNHYFKGGNLRELLTTMGDRLSDDQRQRVETIAATATSVNVRSRQKNDDVLLIIKGSLDKTSAVHSHQRMEFEANVPLTIEQLDREVIEAGWTLEAKWEAHRKLYETMGLTVQVRNKLTDNMRAKGHTQGAPKADTLAID